MNQQILPEKVPNRWPHGVAYEVFVQSFCDSNGDGIGDLPGLTSKLDYLADLGVEALWLMPINPSPSYHKYDITNYYDIHPDYGTLDDFKTLIAEAHQRGIRIIMDLVLNHCSRLHPWFASALHPESPYRDYFIWSTKEEITATGSMTKAKTGDSDNMQQWNTIYGQEQLYFSYFWSGMPDLNYDNPKVRQEAYRIGNFWLREIGVDGFRLDAAKHVFPDHRAKDTHAFWEAFKLEMQKYNPDVYLVGEVWSALEEQLPFANSFSALFNFDLAYSILETVKKEKITQAAVANDSWKLKSGSPVELFIIAEKAFGNQNPAFSIATFLSNHDQVRIRSFLKGNKRKSKLAVSILLTLPGTPYIYYGEEIGMQGKKPDLHLREPFLWSKNEADNTSWMTPRHQEKVQPLMLQQEQESSIFNHYKKLIHLRKKHEALSIGDLKPISVKDVGMLAYTRSYAGKTLQIVHNLSAHPKSIPYKKEYIIFRTHNGLTKEEEMIVLSAYSTVILLNTQNS